MRSPHFDAVIFDLDGTLLDTAPDVTVALQQTFTELGLPPLTSVRARSLIGPPLVSSFAAEGLSEEDAQRAVARYREIFAALPEPLTRPFPNAVETLHTLRARGVLLAVATSKAARSALPLLATHQMSELFVCVHCAGPSSRDADKRDLITAAAGELRAVRPNLSGVAMVGDRSYDVLGARAAGVTAVHAGWGYGAEEGAQADIAVPDWQALGELVLADHEDRHVSP